MNQQLKAALWYQQEGYSVIPIKQNKKPFIKWEKYQAEKAGPDQVEQWWKEHPAANIGLITGEISGITVLDPDTQAGIDNLNTLIPDSLQTPVANTPGGGQHFYFKYVPGIPNKARILPDCDSRNDRGYIVAAPGSNGNGGSYTWVPGLKISEVDLAEMPEKLQKALLADPARAREHKNDSIPLNKQTLSIESQHLPLSTSVNIGQQSQHLFGQGSRDEALFTLANHLVKGGMNEDNLYKYLLFFASNCSPSFPEKEAIAKIQSALNRSKNRSKNLTAEIREWISSTSGNFSSTDVYQTSTLSTSANDRRKISVILGRMVKEGFIERVGNQNGIFRRIESDCAPEDWQNADTSTVPLWLPFDLDRIAMIQPGSIIGIAGEQNAGKTAITMNIARENMRNFKVHYFSSEMGSGAFKRRAEKFSDISIDQWNVEFYPQSSNFQDVIKPGEGNLNIIDYLELHDKFYLVSKHLSDIYNKLDGAIAIIALQKSPGQDDGRGGSFTREKPVLSLAISPGKAKITKLKEWNKQADDSNPNRKEYHFKLVDGCRFVKVRGWHVPVE